VRVLCEEEHQVEVQDPAFAAQVMLGTTLRERHEPETLPPHNAVRVPPEEVIDLDRGETTEAREVGVVYPLVRTGRVGPPGVHAATTAPIPSRCSTMAAWARHPARKRSRSPG